MLLFFRYFVAVRSERILTGEGLDRDLSETSMQILKAPFFLITLTCKLQLPFWALIPASSSGQVVSLAKCHQWSFLELHLSAPWFRKKPSGRKQCCYSLERGKPKVVVRIQQFLCVWSNCHYSPHLGDVCHGRQFLNGKLVKSKHSLEFSQQ